jgi:hypothetical protein
MLVSDLNDTAQALWDIARVLQRIEPDAVHINLPDRPPAETWVQPASEENLMQAMAILGNVAEVVHPAEGTFDLGGYDDPVDAILSIITRHPMREDQLERSLSRWSQGKVKQVLADLEASGRAQVVERFGVRFWSESSSYYPPEDQSRRTYPGLFSQKEKRRSK